MDIFTAAYRSTLYPKVTAASADSGNRMLAGGWSDLKLNRMQVAQKMSLPQRRMVASRPARASVRVQAVAAVQKASASKAPAGLTPEVAKDMYYDMVLGREFEEMCAQMYYRGKMFGFVHLYSGQEAVSAGVIRALRPDDYVCSTYRDHTHALSKGVSARCAQQALGQQHWTAECWQQHPHEAATLHQGVQMHSNPCTGCHAWCRMHAYTGSAYTDARSPSLPARTAHARTHLPPPAPASCATIVRHCPPVHTAHVLRPPHVW